MTVNQWKCALSILCLLLYAQAAYSQLIVVVKSVPVNTPAEDDLYIVGSFNSWNPSDAVYRLNKNYDGTYSIRLPFREDFEFKFTRGSWEKVEGSYNGDAMMNRKFRMEEGETTDTIVTSIIRWEDLSLNAKPVIDTITFFVEHIPSNTPKDAAIYITGDFNDWHPGSVKYCMHQLPHGSYRVKIPLQMDSISYKFTRGDWSSVEGRENGYPIRSRSYVYDKNNTEIYLSIKAWEDLEEDLSLYTYIINFISHYWSQLLIK